MGAGTQKKLESLTATDIVQILIANYHRDDGWLLIPELRAGVGYGIDSERYIDLYAFRIWDSKKNHKFKRVAYEVKISRTDFLNDVADPIKQRPAKLMANQFFYVAPQGVIPVDKVPIDCGLIEIIEKPLDRLSKADEYYRDFLETATQKTDYFSKITISSPVFDYAPTWNFTAALVRASLRKYTGDSPKRDSKESNV